MIDRTFFQHSAACYRLCHRPHETCESTWLDVDGSSLLAAEARWISSTLSDPLPQLNIVETAFPCLGDIVLAAERPLALIDV
jgi:hypothetical protein